MHPVAWGLAHASRGVSPSEPSPKQIPAYHANARTRNMDLRHRGGTPLRLMGKMPMLLSQRPPNAASACLASGVPGKFVITSL